MVKAPARAAALQVGCLAFWVFLGVLVPPARCLATDMRVVAVTPGQSAEVVIEDGAPVTIQVGEIIEGVKLLSADRDGAVLSADGITETLPLVADRSIEHTAGSSTVTLSADARGQFVTSAPPFSMNQYADGPSNVAWDEAWNWRCRHSSGVRSRRSWPRRWCRRRKFGARK